MLGVLRPGCNALNLDLFTKTLLIHHFVSTAYAIKQAWTFKHYMVFQNTAFYVFCFMVKGSKRSIYDHAHKHVLNS